MEATNEQVQSIYQLALNKGHPDPLGFVARLRVLTNLDHDHPGPGIGIAALEKGTSPGANDITSIEGNIVAAVELDVENYAELTSIPDMHVAAALGAMELRKKTVSGKRKGFEGKLKSARREIASKLGISSEAPDSALERETDELTARVIRREAFEFDRQIASPDPVAQAFQNLDSSEGLDGQNSLDPLLAIDPVDLEEERQIQAIMNILRRL